MRFHIIALLICLNGSISSAQDNSSPLRVGVAGLTHGHVHWVFNSHKNGNIQIVGIVEPNLELAQRLLQQYALPSTLIFASLEKLIEQEKPEVVTAYASIYEHLDVVEACAPRGVHVMVEKPLAVNMDHAIKIKKLAEENNVRVFTNYETTWYATHHMARQMIEHDEIGNLRKLVIHDGHQGPKEIGVSDEFLEWLTDPKMNGGGAVVDFGCYGANLATWLMSGEKPKSVTAVLQTLKPEIYPEVDDEATIILEYDNMQAIIQASWNWPYGRKDMEIYGQDGALFCDNRHDLRLYENGEFSKQNLDEREAPFNDPFLWLNAVVKGEIQVSDQDLSSLENNLMVVEILDAARESHRTGKKIILN